MAVKSDRLTDLAHLKEQDHLQLELELLRSRTFGPCTPASHHECRWAGRAESLSDRLWPHSAVSLLVLFFSYSIIAKLLASFYSNFIFAVFLHTISIICVGTLGDHFLENAQPQLGCLVYLHFLFSVFPESIICVGSMEGDSLEDT